MSKDILRVLIERLVSFDELVEVKLGNIYCPFHDNRHTPSARFYYDDDDIIRLQCWGRCKRQYTSYDYIKIILGQEPKDYILKNSTEEELNKYLDILKEDKNLERSLRDEERVNNIHNIWVDSLEDVTDFIDNIYIGFKLEDVE